MQYNILVVDDEKDIRTILSEILEDEGYNTVTCASSSECIDIIKNQSISLVILDVWLGENDLDGIMLLDKIKTINKNLPVIMMSGHSSIEIAIKAIKKGAYYFVEKPTTKLAM